MPETLVNLVDHFPFYAYALVMIFGANFFYQKTSRFSFIDELTERDNPAFGACFAGYLLGVALAIAGAFPTDLSGGRARAALDMTYSGLLAILLLRASLWINHEFILS